MKKIIRLTESDLTRIVKRTILEMNDPKKLSKSEWEKIWLKLRRQTKSFEIPEESGDYYTYGSLDFYYKEDGEYLELDEMFRDPKYWHDDREKGVATLEKKIDNLERIFSESGLGLKLDVGPKFRMRIYKD